MSVVCHVLARWDLKRFVTEEQTPMRESKCASTPYVYLTFRDLNRALISICFISKILLSSLFT